MATELDDRPSNPEFGIYYGFSAIHYAILYEQAEIVRELLESEYFCRLPEETAIMARNIGPENEFILREGMNV